MLHTAMTLLSASGSGARLKRSVETAIRKAIAAVAAAVVLLAAFGFGLALVYNALGAISGFDGIAAAGIVGGILVLIGAAAFAALPLIGPKSRRQPVMTVAKREGVAAVDSGLRSAMRQAGPLTVLVAAFAAGVLLGRR